MRKYDSLITIIPVQIVGPARVTTYSKKALTVSYPIAMCAYDAMGLNSNRKPSMNSCDVDSEMVPEELNMFHSFIFSFCISR